MIRRVSAVGAASRNRTGDLRITSASLYPTELRRHAAGSGSAKSLPVPAITPGPHCFP